MILDSSAILAILYGEEDAGIFASAIAENNNCKISAANALETSINIDANGDATASRQLDIFMKVSNIEVAPVTEDQVIIARQAYLDYGKGNHKAKLNFGDCFAYALSKMTGEPLLFKGNDFIHTDIVPYLDNGD